MEAAFLAASLTTNWLVNSLEQPEPGIDAGGIAATAILFLPTLMYLLGTIAPLRIRPLPIIIGSLCSSGFAVLFAAVVAVHSPNDGSGMGSLILVGGLAIVLFNLLLGGAACIALRAAARSTPTHSPTYGERISPAALGFCLAILAQVILELANVSIATTFPDSSVPVAHIIARLIGLLLISLVILAPGRIKPVLAVLFGLLGAGYALIDVLLMMSKYQWSFVDGFLGLGRFWSILSPLAFGGMATLLLLDRTHDQHPAPPSPATGGTGTHEMPAHHSIPPPLSTGATA